MKNTALVFPGQGAQKAGMGLELAGRFLEAKEVFEQADGVLGFPISRLCWEGPDEELKKTINTQPAILTTSVACLRVLQREGVTPSMVAGHSVGEYAALVAAGVLSFEEGLCLARRRGELMHEAGISSPGTMAAVMGIDIGAIREACEETKGVVEIANFNAPDQIVISGEIAAVNEAGEKLKERGARKVIPLNVGAAFHSSLMKGAAEELADELEEFHFKTPTVPVVVNVSAEALTDPMSIRDALKKQILGSVLWIDSVKNMRAKGIDTFIEVGPGKALGGMIRKIDKDVNILNVEDIRSLEKTRDSVKNTVCT